MLTVHTIDSLDLPELEPYRTMRRMVEHEQRGIFVAEGEKVVRRLLQTRLRVISLLITPEWLERLRPTLEYRPEEVRAYVGKKELLETMVGYHLYHGLLALAHIPGPATLEDVLRHGEQPHLLAGLDGLGNSDNMGVLIRICAAFRVQGLLVGETTCSPWLRRVVRNSMGAIFHLPVIRCRTLAVDVDDLNQRGFRTIAAHPSARGTRLSQVALTGNCCIIFGSEGHGISPAVLGACTDRAAIPMPDRVDSLNVTNAAAAFLYEACRQRGLA